MTETLNQAGMNPSEGRQVGIPGENGFYIPDTAAEQSVVPPEAQRIYDTVADYHDTIQAAYGVDISTLGAEADAWVAAADIASEVEKNPTAPLSKGQHDLLAAVEAHSATFKATATFTAEQRGTLTKLDEASVGNIVHDMARERRTRWDSTTDEQERIKLQREMSELSQYSDMIVNNEVKFDVADIDSAVNAYKDGDNTTLQKQSEQDTKANAYFAKYAAEIVSKTAPETVEEAVQPQTREEKLDAYTDEEMKKMMSDPSELSNLISVGRSDFMKRLLAPTREKYATEPTEENGKKLATLEKELTSFTRLTEFRVRWEGEYRNGSKQDFSEYMKGQQEADEAAFDNPNPESNEYFLRFREANSLASGNKFYGLKTVAYRYARQEARQRLSE